MSDDLTTRPLVPPTGFTMSRRQLMTAGFFGVLGSQLLLGGIGPVARASAAEGDIVLAGEGFTLTAAGGTVTLLDAAGTPRQRFRGYRVGALNLTTGAAALATSDDGSPAIRVNYDVPTAGASVVGHFIPRGRRLEILFDIVSPGTTSASGGMMRREAIPGPVVETFAGVTDWVRDPRGGIPYETNGRTVFEQNFDDLALFIVAPGANSSWRDQGAIHLPGTTVSEGVYQARAHVALIPDGRAKLVEALVSGAALSADVWTDQPYNIFPSGGALTVHGGAMNGGAARPLTFAWTAHDFDGVVLASQEVTVDAGAHASVTSDFSVSLPGRGIAFVELSVTAGADTSYTRTNVAVLPPHEYAETAETAMMGIAADYLFGPPEERALLKRLGVRNSRHTHFSAAELQQYGFTQHRLRTPASPAEFDGDDAALAAYVSAELDTAEAASATHYECANEWNMRGGILKGTDAEKYVTKWATAFRREIDRRGSDIRLIAVGLAGMDHVYADKMFQAGLAQQAHAFNLHPGRGNFTADWAPTPDTWGTGSTGSYWNCMGALNEARRMLDQYTDGTMEFWLTEAYAQTRPNAQWADTYRHAAENALLTPFLAASVGVTRLQWFQFYDNVKANPYGANQRNPEYHFGTVLRDRSPKPTLLALATASEHLDQATFVRWFAFADENLHGMLFDTPRGPLSVIWSRADGYTLNTAASPAEDGFYPTPEPWIDTWPTKTTIELPAVGATVTRVDVLGRQSVLPAPGGKVSVTLDGAPRLFYGLDVDGADAAVPVKSGPVSVKPQRVDNEISVAVHVRNDLGPGTDIRIKTPFGEKKFTATPQGEAVYHLFPTGTDTVGAGTVEVALYRWNNGKPIHKRRSVDYAAFSIRPFA